MHSSFPIGDIKMMKKITMAVVTSFLVASGAYASEPVLLSEAQMDSVTAAQFVCPVFNADAVGANNPNAVPIAGGDYTILGPTVAVPTHATNSNGTGSPGGDHSSPGSPDYTPIWN
jgi:hypothetical protein